VASENTRSRALGDIVADHRYVSSAFFPCLNDTKDIIPPFPISPRAIFELFQHFCWGISYIFFLVMFFTEMAFDFDQ